MFLVVVEHTPGLLRTAIPAILGRRRTFGVVWCLVTKVFILLSRRLEYRLRIPLVCLAYYAYIMCRVTLEVAVVNDAAVTMVMAIVT